MKIGINARTFSVDEPGGAVQTALRMTDELINHPDIDVILFGNNSIKNEFPNTKIVSQHYSVDSQVYGLLWERTFLPYLASAENIDVLYCPNGNAPLHTVSYPVVMCVHDVNAMKGMSSRAHQMYRILTIPQAAKSANAIVTVSQFSKKEMLDEMNIDSSKIHVIYNGLNDVYLFENDSSPIDLPDRYILYVGAFNPRKNITRLVKSYTQLKEESDIPHKLVMVGPGNKSIFKNVDIESSDDIITPGFLEIDELKFAYQNATVFAYPSLYEGFGLPPLEAMASGTPVVASQIESLSEILGDAAELVDPHDTSDIKKSLYEVIDSDSRQEELSNLGVKKSQQYSWKTAGDKLIGIFSQLVNKK